MNIQSITLYSCIIILFCQCNRTTTYYESGTVNQGHTERSATPPNAEPGKCYAKSLVPDQIEQEYHKLPIYTGSDEQSDKAFLRKASFVIRPATTKWVKKKVDNNCHAPNPDDCLVWCLVEEPEETKTVTYVVDTTSLKAFLIEEIITERIVQKGGFQQWNEVVCANKIDAHLINQLCQQLFLKGAIDDCADRTKYDPKLQAALGQYQQQNNLPIGSLNVESLRHLGVMGY